MVFLVPALASSDDRLLPVNQINLCSPNLLLVTSFITAFILPVVRKQKQQESNELSVQMARKRLKENLYNLRYLHLHERQGRNSKVGWQGLSEGKYILEGKQSNNLERQKKKWKGIVNIKEVISCMKIYKPKGRNVSEKVKGGEDKSEVIAQTVSDTFVLTLMRMGWTEGATVRCFNYQDIC